MKQIRNMAALIAMAYLAVSCGSTYKVASVERSRVLVDSRYDGAEDKVVTDFMAQYKKTVDSIMSPVVGQAAEYMAAARPESALSNLLADIMLWAGKDYGERPELAVYNIGGIRAAMAKGDITYGDVLDVAPFENKICFLTLTGDKLMELFEQIASVGGEGVSHGVELTITRDGKLAKAKLNGEEIDPARRYRVATLDYLAQGNDKMEAFKSGTDVNSPTSDENNTRFIIMKYTREKMSQGEAVGSRVEGRIVVTD